MELQSWTSGDRIRYGRDRLSGFRDACSEAPEELCGLETLGFMIAGTKGRKRNMDLWDLRDRSNCTWAQGEQVNLSTSPQRQQEGAAAGPPPAIAKAANPWSARRSAQSEKEKVYRTVKGILNKLTPEKYDVLAEQMMQAGINSAEILQAVTLLIYNKAVLEPMFCAMYVQLGKELSEFRGEQAGDKPVTFRCVLLNTCQEEFEGADALREEIKKLTRPEQAVERDEKEEGVKLRTLGNIKLIGEMFKQKMLSEGIVHTCIQKLLGQDPKGVPAEENVERLCHLFGHLFTTVGRQLEERAKSKMADDKIFARLEAIGESRALPSRIRFMVRDILDVWLNKWVLRQEETKAKTINEIHAKPEAKLGLRPRTMALRNGRTAAMPGFMPGAGGMMIRMPGISGMSGMHGGGRMGDGDQHAGQGAEGQRGVLSGAAEVRLVQKAAVKLEYEFSQKDVLKERLRCGGRRRTRQRWRRFVGRLPWTRRVC